MVLNHVLKTFQMGKIQYTENGCFVDENEIFKGSFFVLHTYVYLQKTIRFKYIKVYIDKFVMIMKLLCTILSGEHLK